MTQFDYAKMEIGVCYYASYILGGYCVIKKTAENIPYGEVRARMGGKHLNRHFTFFDLGEQVDPCDEF